MHVQSRHQHPLYETARIEVPDDKVNWLIPFDNYIERRPYYIHPDVENNLKLKDDDPKRWAEYHVNDKYFNKGCQTSNLKSRITFINGFKQTLEEANIMFDKSNLPINPKGRTGMYGPGLLGKNGPNQTADPIFTRWAPFTLKPPIKVFCSFRQLFTRNYSNQYLFNLFWELFKSLVLLFPHLEMIAIQRRDTKVWAIPGGMVETGSTVSETLRNEINQEACNNMDSKQFSEAIDEVFSQSNGKLIYRGYVDDPRNTDSRWLETTAVHFHCPNNLANSIKLNAGDDAKNVTWLTMCSLEPRYKNLYANHKYITDKAVMNILIPFYIKHIIFNILPIVLTIHYYS